VQRLTDAPLQVLGKASASYGLKNGNSSDFKSPVVVEKLWGFGIFEERRPRHPAPDVVVPSACLRPSLWDAVAKHRERRFGGRQASRSRKPGGC
jgi:hypothetical protein